MSDTSSFKDIKKQPTISWILGLISLFLVIGGYLLAYHQFQRASQANQRLIPILVERTNLNIVVTTNGTVEPAKIVNMSPKTAGILKQLFVDEGYYLRKGQVIAKMDDSNLQGQLLQALGKLAQAEANLRKFIAGNRPQEIAQENARLEGIKAIFKKADDEFRRNQKLLSEGVISQQTLNEKLAARDSSQAAVVEVQQKLSLLEEGTRQEEIEQARADVIYARGTLQIIQTQINDTVIKSPFDGIVAFKYAEPGAFVTPTTSGSAVSSATSSSILSIVSQNEVVSNVADKNIDKIRIGQKVIIKADAYPGQIFLGRVSLIATQATVEQNVTSFKVKVALERTAAKKLKAGMNVSTDFQIGQVKSALTVPTIAVTRQNNQTGVFVGAPNQPPRFVHITTGVTINNRTEVKSGLDGSEHILINPPSELSSPPSFSWKSLFGGTNNQPPAGGPPPGGLPPGAPSQETTHPQGGPLP